MNAITFLVIATAMGAQPGAQSSDLQLIQYQQPPAFQQPTARFAQGFSGYNGPALPSYSHVLAPAIYDDLPDRPRLDIVPYSERSQLGWSTRRAGDPYAAAPASTTGQYQPPYQPNSYPNGQPNRPFGQQNPLGQAQPGNFGQNQYPPYDSRTTGGTQPGFGNPAGQWAPVQNQGGMLSPPPSTRLNDFANDNSNFGRPNPLNPYATNANNYGTNNYNTNQNPIPYRPNFDNGPAGGFNTANAGNHFPPQRTNTNPPNWSTGHNAEVNQYSSSHDGYHTADARGNDGLDFNRSRPNFPAASIGKQPNTPPTFSTTFASLLLFASLGGNIYLGWLARDFYWRFRDLAWQMRSHSSADSDV